jgi:hypothetical protein
LAEEKIRAEAAEAKTLQDANAYTDTVKANLLGDGIKDTFDTLVEIQNWIESDEVNTIELTSAIATETSRAQTAENELTRAIADEAQARAEAFDTLKSAAYREEVYFVSKAQYDLDIATKDAQIIGLNTEAKRLTNEVKDLQATIETLVARIEALENKNNTEE